MNCYSGWIALVASVAVFAASCAEHSSAVKPSSPGVIAPSTTDFEGTISRIDAQNDLVTVEHWPLSKTFRVPPDCQIDIPSNENATLTQLKIDDAVIVTYSEAGKDLVATRIARRGKAYDQERRERMERLNEMLNPSPNQ